MFSATAAFFNWPEISDSAHTQFPPSTFILNSSYEDILAAVATAEVDPNIPSGQYIRLCSYESMMYQWIFDCVPPAIADLFYFFCLRANLLYAFCHCHCSRSSGFGTHDDYCSIRIIQTQLIVSTHILLNFSDSNNFLFRIAPDICI